MNIFTKVKNYFVRHQIIEHFHPSWFAMTMSWGVNAGLLHAMPFLPVDESVNPDGAESIRNFKKILNVLCKIIWATNSFYWILSDLGLPTPELGVELPNPDLGVENGVENLEELNSSTPKESKNWKELNSSTPEESKNLRS